MSARSKKFTASPDVIRRHGEAHDRLQAVARRAHRVVRPLMRVPPRRPAEQVGSGVFMEIGGQKFLLTAAHVLDEFGADFIYAAGQGAMIPIAGPAERTHPPLGKTRDADRIDAAVLRITNEIGTHPGVEFLSMNEVDAREWMKPAPDYLLYGYPESKTVVDLPSLQIRGERLQILSPRAELEEFASVGVHPELHVVFGLDKKQMMSDAGVRAMPHPRGMSGSGVWAVRGLREDGSQVEAHLVGIFTELPPKRRLGIATRLNYHFELIRSAWPEFARDLPVHGKAPIRLRRLSESKQ